MNIKTITEKTMSALLSIIILIAGMAPIALFACYGPIPNAYGHDSENSAEITQIETIPVSVNDRDIYCG